MFSCVRPYANGITKLRPNSSKNIVKNIPTTKKTKKILSFFVKISNNFFI